MAVIPPEIAVSEIRDETTEEAEMEQFVQLSTDKRLLCFVTQMFRMAKLRVFALRSLSDGCHSVAPRELGGNSQLYTINGISSEGITVPLVNYIVASKSTESYLPMYKALRKQLVEQGFDMESLYFITDYESASIRAASLIFPEAIHEGCSFHWVRALIRNRGGRLTALMEENEEVERWFRRVVALVYFPKQYIGLTRLLQPELDVDKEGKKAISDFLKYFNTTWMNGRYADKWNKFLVEENRTTNRAENYHSRLVKRLESKNPKLETILKLINDMSFMAYTELKNNDHKYRKADRERKAAISGHMNDFLDIMKERGIKNIPRDVIYSYLDKMTKFLPTQAV